MQVGSSLSKVTFLSTLAQFFQLWYFLNESKVTFDMETKSFLHIKSPSCATLPLNNYYRDIHCTNKS